MKENSIENEKKSYNVILAGGQGKIEEKKSRFISSIQYVSCEEDAIAFIEQTKKKYWDARHNCFAYILGERGDYVRYSDDGEPQGTAGKPMLEILQRRKIRNVVVVVTRYFGGTLLGTGGLVHAYSESVKEGLSNCQIGQMSYGVLLEMKTDYNGIGKILYILGQNGITNQKAEYGVDVTLSFEVKQEMAEKIKKSASEVTDGQIIIEEKEWHYFVDKEKND